ncbi:MAG: helix-turn-helix transcriptional regulator [Candidatus Omnitrophica bacterium]|nr:helix-turn-helix transcriptional regulator [Candidatus Omnitrophota bacterium]
MRKSEYPKVVKTLGQRIRKRRMDLGLTLHEVATAIDISEGYLSRIEADKQIPDTGVALNLARKLGDDAEAYFLYSAKKFFPKSINKSSTIDFGKIIYPKNSPWDKVQSISIAISALIKDLPPQLKEKIEKQNNKLLTITKYQLKTETLGKIHTVFGLNLPPRS